MKKQSYKKLYMQIFEDRCIDGEDGRYVVCVDDPNQRIYEGQITTWNFSHIKSKGAYPELKYDPDNIDIVSANWHGGQHSSGEFKSYLPLT